MKNHFLRLIFFSLVSQLALAQTNNAPSNLSAVARSSNRIDLSWRDNSTGESGFEIQRSDDNRTFTKINDADPGAVSYQDATVLPSKRYYYKVLASFRGGTTTGFSNTADATTPAPPPVATDLKATARNATTIDLTWTVSGKEPSYTVERSTGRSGRFTQVGSGSGAFTDNNLAPGTEYCYRVQYAEGTEPAGYSNIACATTQAPAPTVPRAPVRLSATAVAFNQVNLAWADVSDNETGFEIQQSPDGTAWTTIGNAPENAVTYQVNGLNGSTRYYYRVQAVNGVGRSGYTEPVNVLTPAAPVSPPSAPTGLTATAVSAIQINLSWTNTATNATGYEVDQSPDGTNNWTKIDDAPATATTYQSRGLTPNTRYYYRVRAVNQGGSTASNVANAITPNVAPAAPIRLSATAVAFDRVNLSWVAVSGNETGFDIEWSLDGNAWNPLASVPANPAAYTHTGLNGSTRYHYRVRAVNAVGKSNFSDPVSVLTPAAPVPPPSAPTGLTATAVLATQINLVWTNTATNATGGDVEQSPDGTGNWSKVQSLGAGATAYQHTGLTPNTRYFYRVLAVNPGGSTASNVANAITPDVAPAAPIRLMAQATSYSAVSLSWGDGSANETGFEIQQSTDGTTFNRVGTVGANVTSYQATGLNGSTKYYYRVRAVNAIGPSGYSNVVDVTTPQAPLPGIPTNLTAVPVDFDLIKLTWSPVSANTTSVVIERSTSSTTGFVEIGQQVPGKTEFGDVGVLPIATYFYRIKAVNSAGSSDYSNVARVDAEAIIDGLAEPLNGSRSVYTADRTLYINLSQPVEATIQIISPRGSIVLQKAATISAGLPYQYTLDTLPAGLYIVAVQTANARITKKILLP